MRKFLGYVPAMLFTLFYIFSLIVGDINIKSMFSFLLVCFWVSACVLHKGLFWGGLFGIIPAIYMIFMGGPFIGETVMALIYLGIILILFYVLIGFYLWKKQNDIPKAENKEIIIMIIKVLLTIAVVFASAMIGILQFFMLVWQEIDGLLSLISLIVIPSLFLPLIWVKKRLKFFLIWLIPALIYFAALGINFKMIEYEKSIIIDTSPNIELHEYLPFEEDSKIVKIDSETLKLTDNLPRIDGAAALFPVYSAFVNAVYPDTVKLHDGIFEYNNTPDGYKLLAARATDMFIGVYPSDEQKAYAKKLGTTFVYTPIGYEAFVFFVHKNNSIDNLTTEQIQGIYSGEITNWKQLGGKNEEIAAFQRNEGSGSQSMLKRFMGEKTIMPAPTERVNDLMSGIIEEVSNYKSKSNSIGFSFRFYIEGIIMNPDIKMLSIDGVAPTAENIKNGKYPIVTPIYAVTYEEQRNENVNKLLDWILSVEGQNIIEGTGYVGVISDFDE